MTILGKRVLLLLLLVTAVPAGVLAQSLPTSQPAFLRVIREDVKVGRGAEHVKLEAGWPAAFERAKLPDYYLALESSTNNEAWFLIPFASYKALGETMARETEPALEAELARLSRADGDLINSWRSIELRARPELGYGAYPDLAKQRFWEVTVYRMRPGTSETMSAIAKAYAAAMKRTGATIGYRVYEVMAGMPMPTYFIFSSFPTLGDVDTMLAEGEATDKNLTPDDQAAGKKFYEGLVSAETFHLSLSAEMSYVSKEVRASDPGFWMKKRTAVKTAPAAPKPAEPAKKPGQ
jgi:hypothetical protein